MRNPSQLSYRVAVFFSVSVAAAVATSSVAFSSRKSKPFSYTLSSCSSISSAPPKATAKDLLALLGSPQQASSVNVQEAKRLTDCFKFLVPFSNHASCPSKPSSNRMFPRSIELTSDRSEDRVGGCKYNEMICWPPAPVMELARLAIDSGGDPGAIHRALDPTVIQVPDVEGSTKDKCQLTRTPYGRRFINEELNSYLEILFKIIEDRGPNVGLNVSLNRYDLFHGHIFLAKGSGRLGILFHAKEYPAYDNEMFPYNMGYCQRGANVAYDDSMNLRNILWLAPLPRTSKDGWLAPGVLVVLDAHPKGIIYQDLIPEYAHLFRTLYEVSKDIDLESDSLLTRVLQAVAVPVLGNVCHVFMHGLNRVQVYGAEKLNEALLHRPENKGLITVSNHVAAMDDPLVIASLLPPSVMLDAHNLRWTLCATDRCFRNPVSSAFFKYLKVLPVSRGDGIFQKGMDVAISKLNKGGWVHIFPEGSRSRDGGRNIGSIKKGVVRLLLDADNVPIVLPFVHTGMQEVMPIGAKVPRIGKTVTVLVGDPIRFDDIINAEQKKIISRVKLYDAISARIGDNLRKLKVQVERITIEQSLQLQNYPTKVTERSAKILQQIDWESISKDGENYSSEMVGNRYGVNNSLENQNFGTSLFGGGGIVSRIKGYRDSINSMGLAAAREMFRNHEVKNDVLDKGLSPLKAWNYFLQRNCNYSPVTFLAANS